MGSYLPVKQQQSLLANPLGWLKRSGLSRAILPAFIPTIRSTMTTAAHAQIA
jgi:hypothetical protein